MNPVKVHNCVIGEGAPKICVPIVARDMRDLFSQTRSINIKDYDIIEWRADWFEEITDHSMLRRAIRAIRGILGEVPLLFTFRTLAEGGESDIPQEKYCELYELVIREHLVDMVDVELFLGDEFVTRIASQAKHAGLPVIISNHDFTQTPSKEELLKRMHQAEALGADIIKVAMMPQKPQDVLTLLSATEEMYRQTECPLITMSMGKLGTVSRICGELTGSAVTFGSSGKASAPGQIEIDQLRDFLRVLKIHNY